MKLLTDSQMQAFIINGFVTVKADFSPAFHESVRTQAEAIFSTEGNPGNDILPKIPDLADLSTHVLDEVAPLAASPRPDGVVQIDDDRGTRANLDGAFGTLIETAVLVRTGSRLNVWIEPPPVAWQLAGLVPPEADDVTVRFALRNGALVRVAP